MKEEKDIIQAFIKLGCKCSNNGYHLYDIHKWLRESKSRFINIDNNASGWFYNIYNYYGTFIKDGIMGPNEGGQWDSYEETLEAGIWEAYYLLNN